MKIVYKLLLSFLVFVLLIWLVGYLAVSRSQDALKIQIGKRFSSLAANIMAEIESDINSKIELFQEYSKDLTLQSGTSESNQEFEKLDNIQAYIDKKDHEWTSVSKETITPFMQKLISSELSEELREKTEFYEEKHGHRVFAEVFVTNIYGANIGQTGKTTDYRQDDEQWWQKAKRDGVYVADIEYDISANVYSIDIGIRIDDKNGTFAGVMKVVLNIEEVGHIIKEVEESSEYETIEVHLVDRDGEVIASTHHSFGEEMCDKQFLKKMDNDRGYFEGRGHGRDKANVLSSYAVSKGYKAFQGLEWILFVEHRTDEIFMPVTELRNNILVISVIVTIFAILMGFFISRRISDPVTKLKDAVIEIGKGKLDTEIEVESRDEIGQLANTFKNMTEDLKKTTTSIDRLNKEIFERKKADNALAQQSYALGERVKELNCLYDISKVLEKPGISLEKIVQGTADLIPPASQYPEITCARIILDGQVYKTSNFRKTAWKQTKDIMVHGERIGTVEVYYLEEKPETDEGPFLKEEKNLIEAISERLGKISERTRAKETLRESEKKYRDIFENVSDFLYLHDLEGNFIETNLAWKTKYGFSEDDLANLNVRDLIPEQYKPQFEDYLKRVKEHEKDQGLMSVMTKDGSEHVVEYKNSLVYGSTGPIGVRGSARDVTEAKHAEEALHESEEKYKILTENSLTGVHIHQDGKFVFVNDRFAEIHGYRCEEMIGKDHLSLFHPDHRELVEQRASQRLKGEAVPQCYEVQKLRKDGEAIWCEIMVTRIQYRGKPAIMGNTVDISEQVRAQEQIKQSLSEKEVLLKEIHHRVKNNMQVISSLLNLQSKYIKDKQALEMFKDSQNRVKSMALVHEKLYQSGDLTRIDFTGYIRGLTNHLFSSYVISPEAVKLKINVEGILLDVDTAIPCSLIINELVTNSLKYAFLDGREGEIQIELCEGKNNEFTLIVGDNGIGFPEDLDFRNTETLGFQLIITLVGQFGGTIDLDRSAGTTFKIRFRKQIQK